MMAQREENGDRLLTSWKEIGDYLGCDERTCRRWELTLGLPIHRMEGTPKSRAYAYKGELDAWRQTKLSGSSPERIGRNLSIETPRRITRESALHWPKRMREKCLLIIPSIATILITIFVSFRTSFSEPADFSVIGSKLEVRNGKSSWSFDTKLNNLISQAEYRTRFQTRRSFQEAGPKLPYIVFMDINRDKQTEVLFCPKTEDEYYEPGLYCFDDNGAMLWRYKPGRQLAFGGSIYSGDYRIFGFEPYDIDQDGYLEIFLITAHQPHSPSGLIILDHKGNALGEFFNWGRIHDITYVDFDADGTKEIVITGINDEYRRGFLAAFDSCHVSGSSPQSRSYECNNPPPGSERLYLLFPRTDVDEILKPDKVGIKELHLLNNARFELDAQVSHVYFELDFNFLIQEVKPSDLFLNQHQILKAAGKLNSVLDANYFRALKNGVLYWSGCSWSESFCQNQNARTAQ